MIYRLITLIGICTATATALAAPPAASIDSATQPSVNLRRTVTVQVVQETKNAVVNISAQKMVNRRVAVNPFFEGFGYNRIVQVPADSLGSGFIVQHDGYVVTNNHVIDGATQISVQLADGRKLPATLISADPDADLAVLRIHSDRPLPVLQMGDSSDLMIGEPVIAVGNPLGFSHSVSTGIVSALHRNINGDKAARSHAPVSGEQAALQDLIQTDAAINPGNSGGPLLNAYGQVIGINTAIRSDAQNIGFAIPIDRLRNLTAELMNPAQVKRVEIPVKLVEQRTLSEPDIVHVKLISAKDPQKVLESLDGHHPLNAFDAYALMLNAKAGTPLTFDWTNGTTQKVVPTIIPKINTIAEARQKLGIGIAQNSPMLARRYHLAVSDGLFITSVSRGSVASGAGLAPGDILVKLGRYPVATLDALGRLLPHLPSSGTVHVGVVRGNQMELGLLRF